MNETKRKIEKQFNRIDKLAKKGKDQIYEYYKLIDEFVNNGEYGYLEQTLFYYYKIDIVDYKGVDVVKRKTWPDILFQTNSSFQTKLKKMYDSKNVYQTSFDIYSSNVGHIQLSLSNALGSTYSLMLTSTQSVSVSKSGQYIYFETNDSNVFKVDIYSTSWVDMYGTEVPSTRRLIDQISVTQSITKTQIPTAYEGDYLLSVYTRPPLFLTNYKLQLVNNTLLGQIIEVEKYDPEIKYLIENMEFSKLMKHRSSYLEVHKNGIIYNVTTNDPNLNGEQNLLNRYVIAVDILLQDSFILETSYWQDMGYWEDDQFWID